jgi:hypothetical protein
VNGCLALVCGMGLLIAPQALSAQRHPHGVSGAQAPGGAPKADDLTDFKRAIAVQATPDQVAEFERLSKSMQAARKGAQDLRQFADKQSPGDLFHAADLLTVAVGDVQTDNQRFLRGLTPLQKSGLKDATRKLSKADTAVSRHNKALTQHLGRSTLDSNYVASLAEKLDTALGDLEAGQLALATQMGIQAEEPSP